MKDERDPLIEVKDQDMDGPEYIGPTPDPDQL